MHATRFDLKASYAQLGRSPLPPHKKRGTLRSKHENRNPKLHSNQPPTQASLNPEDVRDEKVKAVGVLVFLTERILGMGLDGGELYVACFFKLNQLLRVFAFLSGRLRDANGGRTYGR